MCRVDAYNLDTYRTANVLVKTHDNEDAPVEAAMRADAVLEGALKGRPRKDHGKWSRAMSLLLTAG